MLNIQQAITRTNDCLVYWHIYVTRPQWGICWVPHLLQPKDPGQVKILVRQVDFGIFFLTLYNLLKNPYKNFNIWSNLNLQIHHALYICQQTVSSLAQLSACHPKCQAITWTSEDFAVHWILANSIKMPAIKSAMSAIVLGIGLKNKIDSRFTLSIN